MNVFVVETSSIPPGPRGYWVLGNLPDFAGDLLGFLTRCARDYGDIVRLRLVTSPAVLLNRPNQIEQVLVTRQAEFVKYRFFWRHVTRVFGNGLLTSAGSLWQRQHALMAPAFRQERLALSVDKMVCCANRLFDRWQDGEERDIRADMTRLTLGSQPRCCSTSSSIARWPESRGPLTAAWRKSPSASSGGCSFQTGSRRRETAAIWRLSEISMRPRRAYSRSDGLLVGIGRTYSRRCCKVGMPRGVQWTPGCFVMSWSRCSLQGTRRRRWR